MRRTRHVVLPVRSWQYIGLMIVSLACLTLGLVSRDREGRAGSLAGPELKHTAPHEVDACPNDNPFWHRSPSVVDLAFKGHDATTTTRQSASPDLSLPRSARFRESRGTERSAIDRRNIRDSIIANRIRDTRDIKNIRESQRLTRSQTTRVQRDLTGSDNRRRMSADRRTDRIREVPMRQLTDPSRLLQRRSSDSQIRERRMDHLIRSRSLDSAERQLRSVDRRARSLERVERRTQEPEAREMHRNIMRTDNRRSSEHRDARADSRVERARNIKLISRASIARNDRSSEIRQEPERLNTRNQERSRSMQRERSTESRVRNLEEIRSGRNMRADERRNIDLRSRKTLDRQTRSVDGRIEARRSSVTLDNRRSVDPVLVRSRIDAARSNVRSDDRRSIGRLENRRARKTEIRIHDVQRRTTSTERRSVDESSRHLNRQERVESRADDRRSSRRFDNRRSAERAAVRSVEGQERLSAARRSNERTDDRRSAEGLRNRNLDRQVRLERTRTDVRRFRSEPNERRFRSEPSERRSRSEPNQRRSSERLQPIDKRSTIRSDDRRAELRQIRSERQNRQESSRTRSQEERRVQSSNIRRETSWMDSLRRTDRIRNSRLPETQRRQFERLTREARPASRRDTREYERERRTVKTEESRTMEHTSRNPIYLMTAPSMMDNKQVLGIPNYETFRQVLVLVLCAVYTASLFKQKNGFIKNTLTQAARFIEF